MALAELAAVLFAVCYLLLAIRQNIWCWFCAGVSTTIFVYVYFAANLYMESLLNVFYFAMAVYGWHKWRHAGTEELPVSILLFSVHRNALLTILLLTLVSGFLLSKYTAAAYPYLDSATTYAAIWATFLVAQKVLENWWYWLVIDTISIFIYWSRDLELTALLFAFYVVLIPAGIIGWTRSYRERSVTP